MYISTYLLKYFSEMDYDVLTSFITDNIPKKIILRFSENCLFYFLRQKTLYRTGIFSFSSVRVDIITIKTDSFLFITECFRIHIFYETENF